MALAELESKYIPEKMQGLWVAPDCAYPERYVYHSATHVLYITEFDTMLQSVSLKESGPDYGILKTGNKSYPFIQHDDGILEIAILAEGMPMIDTAPWAELPIDQRREYLRCDRDPPAPHMIALSALPALDILEKDCKEGASGHCSDRLFRYFDLDQNNEIGIEEGIEASMISLYLDAHLPGYPVTNAFSNKLLEDGYRNTGTYMNTVVNQLDRDSSGGLTAGELYNSRYRRIESVSNHPAYRAQKSLLKAYPGIEK